MVGAVVREEDLRRLGVGGVTPAGPRTPDDPGLALAAGALRATVATGRRSDGGLRSPLQVLARLHAVAAAGLVPQGDLGRPRPGAAAVLPAVAAVAAAEAPAALCAAVVHAELVLTDALAPVGVPVAFAFCRALARERGLDPMSLGLPEAAADADGDGYREALARYGDEPGAWAAWWLRALASGARHGRDACDAVLAGSF